MAVDDLPLFGMMKSRLGWLTARERTVATNIANAETPGFVPRDMKLFTGAPRAALSLPQGAGVSGATLTSPMHIAAAAPQIRPPKGPAQDQAAPDTETTLDGNAVVLEDQMLKMADARLNHDAAIGFYQRSMALLRMAARAPGR